MVEITTRLVTEEGDHQLVTQAAELTYYELEQRGVGGVERGARHPLTQACVKQTADRCDLVWDRRLFSEDLGKFAMRGRADRVDRAEPREQRLGMISRGATAERCEERG